MRYTCESCLNHIAFFIEDLDKAVELLMNQTYVKEACICSRYTNDKKYHRTLNVIFNVCSTTSSTVMEKNADLSVGQVLVLSYRTDSNLPLVDVNLYTSKESFDIWFKVVNGDNQ